MFDYISGKIVYLSPTYLVIENNGIGYLLNISINTYSSLKIDTVDKLLVHQIIREDAHLLYGFKDTKEREMFRLLISVSGIGSSTAIMILSSMSAVEVAQVIANEKHEILQKIKGIGAKTAQRLVVELKDKVVKILPEGQNIDIKYNTFSDEALSALVMLGFPKQQVEKVLRQIVLENQNLTVEEQIKKALKVL